MTEISLDKNKFGPWALITGASSGIGKECARQIAASGINVVLVARREALLKEVGANLSAKYGIKHRIIVADLSEQNFMEKIIPVTNDLDIGLLISNAGAPYKGAFLNSEWDDLAKRQHLNALSHLEIAHYFGRKFVKRGKGGILFSGAMGAMQGLPFVANECGAKACIQSIGEALNIELKPFGVNVSVLVIAPTDTDVIKKTGIDPSDMPMKPMSVEQCAFEGLQALSQNKATHINGRINRIITTLMPDSAMRQMSAKMFTKSLAAQGTA